MQKMIHVNGAAQEQPKKTRAFNELALPNLVEKLAHKVEFLERENEEQEGIT